MGLSKSTLSRDLVAAAKSGTLVTQKHDPQSVSVACAAGRSIIDPVVSSSMCEMFESGSFDAVEYRDGRFKSPTFVINPHQAYASLGTHIPSGSTGTTGSYDRIVAVSGSKQGWHVFAENQSYFDDKLKSGSIELVGPVT